MRTLFYPLCAANEPYLLHQFLSRNKKLNHNNKMAMCLNIEGGVRVCGIAVLGHF